MKNQNEDVPLIKFEGDASAPILRYDIPSPSSYTWIVYIETDIGKEYFGGEKIFIPKDNKELFEKIKERFLRENQVELKTYLSSIHRSELEKENWIRSKIYIRD